MKSKKKRNNNSDRINHGLSHWKLQRISAILIIPLILWFLYSVLTVMFKTYSETIEWVMSPINSTLLIILLVGIFYHSAMGLQVVIEDYIANIKLRTIILNISKIVLFAFAVISISSVLKIVLF
tara:strand:+ start:296 stop:667 length:372 start_codon:yes stop_codon:yes gene_type:complete